MTNDTELSALLAAIAAGDADALGAFYDASVGLVFGLALRILRHREDAEEVTQDVYAQVWRSAAGFDRSRGAVAAWLVTLAKSRALDRLRARWVRPEGHAVSVSDASWRLPHVPGASWETAGDVARLLRTLDAPERALLRMAFSWGWTHVEIARATGHPLGTVKTRIRRALAVLRQRAGALTAAPTV